MTTLKSLLLTSSLCLLPAIAFGQGGPLDPAALLKPLGDSWPTYSGDYTGKRYSSLKEINQTNVKGLTMAWYSKLNGSTSASAGGGAPAAGGGRGGGGGGGGATIVGGEGPEPAAGTVATPSIKGAVLMINGVLYLSAPDHAWAIDAHDGRELWHYFWKTKGGTHIGNRGLAMYGNWLFMETPDDFLVSIDAKTGKERWHKVISDFSEQYFSTMAPIVVGNHILVGTGDDLDAPGFLQSFDPETGDVQWKTYLVPMKKGDPGLESWPNLDAAQHGGAQPWIPGSYDPETHLYIFGTGNPTPAYTNADREGDNLYTCSLVAMDVDTGKMKWYFQTSPHETHDWDSTQTPIFVDAPFGGKPRKLVLQATRNGFFFVLDRVTGEHLVTKKFSKANWDLGVDPKGRPIRNPAKDPTIPGSLVSPTNGGSTNWPPPTYSPDTGLFYVRENNGFAMYYQTEADPRGAMGLGGKEEDGVGSLGSYITAIDYKTGNIAWRHESAGGGGGGLLTTAGKLLFAGDGQNFVAYDPANGKPLWHSQMGGTTNAPETYSLDGHQYVLAIAGDTMFTFTLQ